jgi:hypothetical protein
MDTSITGTITWRPDPGSNDASEELTTFSLFRDKEGDEVLCMSSMQFNRTGVKLSVGERVTLYGAWVVDNATGISDGFLFHKAAVAPA